MHVDYCTFCIYLSLFFSPVADVSITQMLGIFTNEKLLTNIEHQCISAMCPVSQKQKKYAFVVLFLWPHCVFSFAESQDSGYLYFCFRWLLIRFKRELSFQDVLRLWEVSSVFDLELCTAITRYTVCTVWQFLILIMWRPFKKAHV